MGATDTLNPTIAPLTVFDRLEVGPVKLEANRLVVPYRLVWGTRDEGTELIYTYEEAVFKPEEPESRNLADMIGAQAALNYGLFCKKMVFIGTFDALDRRLIRDMCENTAREIFVKKFLEPNVFLTGPAASLPAAVQKKYARAVIEFKRPAPGGRSHPWRLWETQRHRHCILSSGGKDSLLTFALADEIGAETHPVFLNESGRHWFTALNAYRHFRDHVPHTARVWVNSDRLFSWMLQRMPFIRKDFANIRSDEYPIRLWTVAVFLFGALPLMRKRGIGRLLVGNEFDTTVRGTLHGIPHYNGLFDQSIYFDQALSRYFMKKGWHINIFSILRPLSELLIEKILAARYPALQAHQLSCHAGHKQEDRILPCGRCEKCRRIISMLTALDVDPNRCGYDQGHITECFKHFTELPLSQAKAEYQHLGHLLAGKGLIGFPPSGKPFKEHPEVMALRYDPRISPLNGIPVDLREPLHRIFMQYADGAVHRTGRRWQPFDPLATEGFRQPYPFELPRAMPADAGESDTVKWGSLTWPDAAARLKQVDVALLPVGATEQHGPHLPLDTDAFDAEYLAMRVAEACDAPHPLVLPAIAYGISYHHDDFPGTVSITNDTLSRLIYDIGMSAARNGIRKLVIINGHGGNSPALNQAAQMINRDARIFVCVDTGETSDVDIAGFIETPNDVHAGEIETSTSLAVRPELVRMNRAVTSVPAFSSRYLDFTSKRGVLWYAATRSISESGVMGDPSRASAEKGEKIWDIMIAHLVALVEDLRTIGDR
jgi:creatinine amidohydrolase/Fe(II)-dependent formamide hydrolase-like protein/7-cyano-7-deazaguanine synthase in queuosine biosynthesis